jgi:hypothetical protein
VVGRNPVVVAVVVEADPLGIVAAARVSYRGPDGAARSMASGGPVGGAPGKGGAARYDLELPHGVTRITVAAIDQHGNRVVELGTADAPLVLDVDPADQPADRRADGSAAAGEPLAGDDAAVGAALTPADRDRDDGATPFYASWILWGGVAVAAGAGGVWAGLSARSAVDELDDIRGTEFEVEFSDAQAIADRAERRSLIANVCFAGAGASAVVAGILFVRDLRRGPGPEAAASVAPVVGPDRVGVAASLRF